jgi:hypothetical protein
MAEAFKVLGQSNPAATTATTLYTVPGGIIGTVVTTLSVCNTGTTSTTFRIAVRPAGAALALQHYLMYDANIGGNVGVDLTLGVTLAPTDVITVYAGNTALAFSAFGTEVSP